MTVRDLHFLVAEDHEFQRRAVVAMLKSIGATEIVEAPDGQAAYDAVLRAKPPIDIIVCDLDMPGMDGMALIRHLGDTGLPVSIILSSALDRALLRSIEMMTQAYGIALLGAIEKPVTRDKLAALIGLYRAPQSGKRSAPRVFSRSDIQGGLARGEFEAFFQPKVAIASGEVIGAEALARWRHPELGEVGAGAFIGLMEESGLINDLSWTMLEQAARQSRVWSEAGSKLKIAINLSLRSLTGVDLADQILRRVQAQGADPRNLILEVTETIAMSDIGRSLENLARLRMRGFGLAIDDYGTGYSSMQQLSRVAFTELKVDQSFVRNALDIEASRIILDSSLAIARKMKLISVAEGVETKGLWDLLTRLGCDVAQGFLLGRPMSADEFTIWMRDFKPPV